MTDGNNLPTFVSIELREREAIWHFQGVLVLRGHGPAAHDGKHARKNRNRQHPLAAHRIPRFYWLGGPNVRLTGGLGKLTPRHRQCIVLAMTVALSAR